MAEVAPASGRSGGLIAFGVLQILIGLICAMLVLYIASSSELAVRQGPAGSAAVASGLTVYGIATVYFIAAGVGSMKQRRWAQALSVVVSAMWLAGGLVTTLLVIVMLPSLQQRTTMSGAGLVALTIVFAIIIPAAILMFYRRDSIRALCEAADISRWTDRVPLPILAVMIVLGFLSLALFANLANPQIAMFGTTISGAPAAVTLLALAILSAWLVVQFYRLKESAWWTLVLLQVIGCVIAITSLVRGGSTRADAADAADISRSPFFVAILVASWLAYFAFLLYIRRYFALRTEPRTRTTDTPPPHII